MKYSAKIAGPQICYRTENLVNFRAAKDYFLRINEMLIKNK